MKHFIDSLLEGGEVGIDSSEFAKDMLREAYLHAQNVSTDDSTWAGASIVKGEKILSKGANVFANGVIVTDYRLSSPAKRLYQDHSERNAIFKAAKVGIPLDGSTIYATWVPCPPCSNGIIISGINRVVIHYEKAIRTRKDWSKELSESILMLLEAGVQVDFVLGKIGGCESKFKGEIWEP